MSDADDSTNPNRLKSVSQVVTMLSIIFSFIFIVLGILLFGPRNPVDPTAHILMNEDFGSIQQIEDRAPEEVLCKVKAVKPNGFIVLDGPNDTSLQLIEVGAINPIDGPTDLQPDD